MACGTGKTFTSLRLAERLVGAGGSILFLVPSISLLSQSLREWSTAAEVPLAPLAVCSDKKATARFKATSEDISAVDLALRATTNVAVLESRLTQALTEADSMTVVFATYQSIDVVAQAQRQGELPAYDLIIGDEAHRTTGTIELTSGRDGKLNVIGVPEPGPTGDRDGEGDGRGAQGTLGLTFVAAEEWRDATRDRPRRLAGVARSRPRRSRRCRGRAARAVPSPVHRCGPE